MPSLLITPPVPSRGRAATRTASVIITGDDVYEDLFTASCELQDLLVAAGFVARVRFGSASLADASNDDLVVLYTAGGKMRNEEQSALAAAVAAGTGLLALHSTVLPRGGALDRLTGVVFGSHGPYPHESRFTVRVDRSHPIFADAGQEATAAPGSAPFSSESDGFTIEHEHYRVATADGVRVAAWREAPYGREPIVTTRIDGAGRVCWVQLGHDRRVWGEPSVRQLITAAAHWLARRPNSSGSEE
jgi:Uncharacterized protein conserved in bacteria